MYFYVSKLFWLLLPPLNFIVLCGALGLLFGGRKTKTGSALLCIGCALFIVFGILPTGKIMLRSLEERYPPPSQLPAHINGVLVMGGAFDVGTSLARHNPTMYDSAERISEAVRLMKLYPQATIVYSGGNTSFYAMNPSEAEVFKAYLAGQMIPDTNVRYEHQSRNSYENVMYSLLVAKPTAKDTWLIVTSAAHMPRTINVLEAQHWPGTLVPDPVDFQTAGDNTDFVPDPNIIGNLAAAHLAIREWIALAVYRVMGKTDSLL